MFLTKEDQAAMDKLKQQEKTVATEAAKATSAVELQAKIEQEKVDLQLKAIERHREQKNAMDKALAAAFKEGGKVVLTISAHVATAEDPVVMEIDLSNTEINRDGAIQSHRGFIHVNAIQLASQQGTLAENQIKAKHPVQHANYLKNK